MPYSATTSTKRPFMPRTNTRDGASTAGRRHSASPPPSLDLLRTAFRTRAVEAIERLAEAATPEALADALSAPTGAGSVARLLADSAALGAIGDLEPMADAVARGAQRRSDLAKMAGGLLTASQMGAALGGISRQAVDKRRRAGQLLAMRAGADWRYPAAQADRDGTVPDGLSSIIQAMASVSPWVTLDFLLTPDTALGGLSPLNALRRGGALAATVQRMAEAGIVDSYG